MITVGGPVLSDRAHSVQGVLIDCDDCAARDVHCADCVMTVLLGHPGVYEVDAGEQLALAALADGGLVAPLRLVPKGVPEAS